MRNESCSWRAAPGFRASVRDLVDSITIFTAAGDDPEGDYSECHNSETHLIQLAFMAIHY